MRYYDKLSEKLIQWIQNQILEAGCEGAVVGLSGGLDSSVTAVLCNEAFPESTLGLIMPCYSSSEDSEDAKLVADEFSIDTEVVNLNQTFDTLCTELKADNEAENDMAVANIKPRLRMTVLYYYAAELNYLVVGTDNCSELEVGYFTKHGDGGIDIAPLGNLVKTEVRQLAKYLEIPEKIITKPPTAGLWSNQTDEDELGITYEELDRYILTGEAEPEVKERIEDLAAQSEHKLGYPPTPEF